MTRMEMNRKGCTDLLLEDCATRTYQRVDAPVLTEEDSQALALELMELVKKNAIDRKRFEPTYVVTMMYRGSASSDNFVVSDEFAKSFFAMYKLIADASRNTYTMGLSKGKSLLIGLNDGSMSLKEFESTNQE